MSRAQAALDLARQSQGVDTGPAPEATLKQLYHQNPGFGFHLISLVAARLSQDVRRIEQRLAELSPPH